MGGSLAFIKHVTTNLILFSILKYHVPEKSGSILNPLAHTPFGSYFAFNFLSLGRLTSKTSSAHSSPRAIFN